MEMYTATQIIEICKCSKAKAYNIIKSLNSALIKNGAPKESIISGKISKKFFHETLKI